MLVGEAQARQVQQEREGPRAEAQVAEKLASVGRQSHVFFPLQSSMSGGHGNGGALRFRTGGPRRQGRACDDLDYELADIVVVMLEEFPQLRKLLRAEGADGLLDQVMEELR